MTNARLSVRGLALTHALAVALAAFSGAGCYLSHRRMDEAPPGERGPYVSLGVGDDHTCAVRDDGALDCWGLAQHGQLGEGTGRPELGCELRVTEGPMRSTPVRALLEVPVLDVAGGALYSCAALDDGTGACWGTGCRGELGDGTVAPHFLPAPILGAPRLVAIAAGLEHVCALDRDGAVYCWGGNAYGQLGLGTTSPLTEPGSTTPVLTRGVPRGVVSLAAGDAHSCAATAREVWCWGANGAGQLGDGTTDLRSIAAPVLGLPPGEIASLAAGERFTCASIRGAGVWCWGWNERYQLGSSHRCDAPVDDCMRSETPLEVELPAIAGAYSVACGGAFACAYGGDSPTSDGVWCWGADEVGQLGDGTIGGFRARPERVLDAPAAARDVVLGDNHGCALSDGHIWCWGRNAQGQLGDSTTVDRARAAPIVEAE